MSAEPFASAPFVVGESARPMTAPRIPAQELPAQELPAEEALCPVVSHDWVNGIQAPGGRGVAQGAGRQAGPVLQSAVPVARCRRAVAAPAAERLSHRPRQRPHRVSLQMRGPRHPRPGHVQAGRRRSTWSGRSASAFISIPPGRTSSCSAAASGSRRWRRSRSSPRESGVGVTAILSARSPRLRDGGRSVRAGRRRRAGARQRRHERRRECREDPAAG